MMRTNLIVTSLLVAVLLSDLTPAGLSGYMWNATIPKGSAGAVMLVLDDRIIGRTYGSTGVTLWAQF